MKNKITCRPCKEQPGSWEIQNQNGVVEKQHYATKEACVNAANLMANEASCELVIEDTVKSTSSSNN